MPNKLPRFRDNHKICIICEGNEEYEYLDRLIALKVWSGQYDISLVNAGGNGNIPARYQDRYQNGSYEIVLVFCDTEKKPHEQYVDIKRKINEFHVSIMLRMKALKTDDSVLGSSNFGRFIKLFESDDSGWIDEINTKIE